MIWGIWEYTVWYNKLMLDFYKTLEADQVIKFILEKFITFFDGFNYKKFLCFNKLLKFD